MVSCTDFQFNKIYFYSLGASDYEFFEGDIMLPKEEIEAIKKGQDPNSVGSARGLRKNRHWPGGIVYYTIDTRKLNFSTQQSYHFPLIPCIPSFQNYTGKKVELSELKKMSKSLHPYWPIVVSKV